MGSVENDHDVALKEEVLLRYVREVCDVGVEDADVSLSDIRWTRIGDGTGFLGRLLRCQGSVTPPEAEPQPFSFVVKLPPPPDSPMASFVATKRLFETETAFYRLVGACLPPQSRPRLAKFHFSLEPGRALALEDLSAGTVAHGLDEGLTFEECRAALAELAKVHSLDLDSARRAELELAKTLEKQGGAPGVLRGAFEEALPGIRDVLSPRISDGAALAKLEAAGAALDNVYRQLEADRKQNLMAGDVWAGNILFRTDGTDAGQARVAALLDFQFAGFSSSGPIEDVIFLLGSSLGAEDRRRRRRELFEGYVALRTDLATDHQGKEKLLEDLEKALLPIGMAFAVSFGAELIVRDGKLLPRFEALIEDYISNASEGT
ncbi:kinase-like domain-containing protein [Hyaloraphidium curvatum]|nr:kinase-like domain-containing protein [Hyaloraphidium curvatum]